MNAFFRNVRRHIFFLFVFLFSFLILLEAGYSNMSEYLLEKVQVRRLLLKRPGTDHFQLLI